MFLLYWLPAISLLVCGIVAAPRAMAASTVAITSPTSGQTFSGGNLTITGTATTGKTVTVKVDGNSIGTAVATGGNWSISATNVAAGSHTIVAEVTDGPYLYASLSSTISVIDTNGMNTVAVIGGLTTTKFVLDQTNNRLYGLEDNTVKVVDTSNYNVISTIAVGNNPNYLALTPDKSKLYVINSTDHTISVISTGSLTVTNTISIATHGDSYVGLGFNSSGSKAYIVSTGNWHGLTIINTATELESGTIVFADNINSVAFSSAGDRIYIGQPIAPTNYHISTVSTSSDTVTNTINFSDNNPYTSRVRPMALNQDNSRLYIGNSTNHTITIVDTSTYQVIGSPIPVITTDGFGSFVYSNINDSIYFTLCPIGGDFCDSQIGVLTLATLSVDYVQFDTGTGIYFSDSPSMAGSSTVISSSSVSITISNSAAHLPRVGTLLGLPAALALLVTFGFVYVDYRHHRFALQAGAMGGLPVYTLQNHVRYVTIPRVQYRLAERFSSPARKL